MKKYLFSILVLLSGLTACAQNKNSKDDYPPAREGYAIKVKIKGIKPGSQFILANYLGDKPYARDTAFADAKGIATFSGKDRLERGIYMVLLPGMSYFEILSTDNNYFSIETDTTKEDYYQEMVITGSPENTRFVAYNLFLTKKGIERSKAKDDEAKKVIDKEVDAYKQKQIKEYPKDLLSHVLLMMEQPKVPDAPEGMTPEDAKQWQYNYYVAHYWDNIDLKEEGLTRTPGAIFQNILDRFYDKVISQDPDSLIKYIDIVSAKMDGNKEVERFYIWYMTRKYETSKVMCHDAVFAHMARKFYCAGKAFWADSTTIAKICEKAEMIGYTTCKTKVPDLRCADINDQYHHLYQEKGRYIVLIFWDPTCGHCKKVLPKVEDLKKRMGDTISVYAVSSEGKYDEWVKYTNEHPELNKIFTNVCKTDRYFPWPVNRQHYDIQANPTIFLLDSEKKVIAKKIDEDRLEEFIIYMLGEDNVLPKELVNARIKDFQAKHPEPKEEPATNSESK
ncbi:MAG: DUF5106 domain-containing protein [Bacteroidetes bacterium]|nr:DUF5106 domain-containing protein [Bacteroidota bacterium]